MKYYLYESHLTGDYYVEKEELEYEDLICPICSDADQMALKFEAPSDKEVYIYEDEAYNFYASLAELDTEDYLVAKVELK